MKKNVERIVKVQQGKLRGTIGRNPEISVFRGVPYAAPPTGPLRWRPPQKPIAWQGVRACNREPVIPLQQQGQFADGGHFAEMYRSEDCLTLDVWTPAQKGEEEKYPVMVWCFGGSFQGGYASDSMYDSELLAAKGIVCVTLNMRLGVMGYLCHPDLVKESGAHTCGNYGLLDIAFALQWIQENIHAFSGDPKQVVLVGQSTGAMSLCRLVASGLIDGLYAGLILQSGDPLVDFPIFCCEYDQAMREGQRFAEALGADSIDALRALPPDAFYPNGENLYTRIIGHPCVPVQDPVYFATPFELSLFTQRTSNVPMLLGSNADDAFSIHPCTPTELRTNIKARFTRFAEEVLKLYPFSTTSQALKVQNRIERDFWFARLRYIALVREKIGHTKTWQYFFTQPYLWPGIGIVGAVHVSELPYVFGSIRLLRGYNYPWDETNDHVFQIMSSFWGSFIQRRDPNVSWLPFWHTRDANHSYMEIGLHTGMQSDDMVLTPPQLDLWTRYCQYRTGITVE